MRRIFRKFASGLSEQAFMSLMRNIFYPIIIIALLTVGCSKSDPEATDALTHAESLMEEKPDSALRILTAIDTVGLRTDGDRALYALLYTQAQLKTHNGVPSFSRMQSAIDYYDASADLHHKMLANFYYGYMLNLNDSLLPKSVQHLLVALDIAEESDNDFFASLASRELAVVFQKTYNPAEEVEYAEKSYNYMLKSGRQPYLDWAMSTLAISYNNHKMNDKSINLSLQLLDTINYKRHDDILKVEILQTLIKSLISEHRSNEAIYYLEQLLKLSSSSKSDATWLGLCYALKGEKDRANWILQHMDSTSQAADWLRYEVYEQTGNYIEAFKALKDIHEKNENLLTDRFTQSATLSMIKHHEQEKLIANEKAKTARITTWLIIIGSIFLLMIALAIIILIRRRQIKEHKQNEIIAKKLQQTIQFHELEKRMAQNKANAIQQSLDDSIIKYKIAKQKANELSASIEQKEVEIDKLNQEITQINDEFIQQRQAIAQQTAMYYNMIDRACTILWENPSKEAASGKITGWLDSFIEDLGSSPKKIRLLESYADRFYENIMTDLRKELPEMKEDDYKLFLFNLLGLSSAAIAKLLNADRIDPIYTRKKRLRKKLMQLPENMRPRFIQYLQRNKDILDF